MPLDTKERIKQLCAELSSSSDPNHVQDISSELQLAIHEHIEDLRKRLLAVPALTPFQQLSFDLPNGPAQNPPDLSSNQQNSQRSGSQIDIYCAGTGSGAPAPGRDACTTQIPDDAFIPK